MVNEIKSGKLMSEESTMGEVGAEFTYKPLSIMAVVALAGSLTAPLVFYTPVLFVFPLVAAILGAKAYLSVLNSDRPMTGGKLALLAIMISIGVSSMALTNRTVRQNYMYGFAEKFSDEWFALIQKGDVRRAHQLTIIIVNRVNSDQDEHLDTYYDEKFVLLDIADDPNRKPHKSLENFKKTDPVFAVTQAGSQCKVKYLGRDYYGYRNEPLREIFILDYEITPNVHNRSRPNTEPIPLRFQLVLERRPFEDEPAGVQWRVTDKIYLSGGPPRKVEISGPGFGD